MQQSKEKLLITIDGGVATGSTTLLQNLMERLQLPGLSTGILYRVLALEYPDVDDYLDLALFVRSTLKDLQIKDGVVWLRDEDITTAIRIPRVEQLASRLAALPEIREELLPFQRDYFAQVGHTLIAEGRDLALEVYNPEKGFVAPDKTLFVRIFLTVSDQVGAQRRYDQLRAKGVKTTIQKVVLNLKERNERDQKRAFAPLLPHPKATIIDTTELNPDQVLMRALALVGTARIDARRLTF